MTTRLRHALDVYAREVSRLATSDNTTEPTYYPAVKSLIEAALADLELRLDVRASTSEVRRGGGRDAPDFAICDGAGGFVMMYVEVKDFDVDIRELATSQDRNDQIGRYLEATGAVLLCTIREFAVITPGNRPRRAGVDAPSARRLSEIVELWPSNAALRRGERIADEHQGALADLLEEALTRHTPIASPETLARVLARQARHAAAALPPQFTSAVASLREDFATGLGISFETEEGEHFFRSSLIQTVYYGLFAGWLLHASEWRPVPSDAYDWQRTGEYLRIPFLAGLFHEIQNPRRLRELGIRDHLQTAAATLDRVHREEFFARLRLTPTRDDEGFTSAIVYFYEPFLAAFDPALRDELGVWYTPPDIVRYQVRRIDQLLREQLACRRGLADDSVIVLDPACGTGAYLIETLRCIADTLRSEGVGAELAATLRSALEHRIRGFEILTAPFVVAHLQLYLLLAELGAPPDDTHRAGVFLTNALTGWHATDQAALHFPELQEEHDAARRVKRDERIVVVLGNPPYNRFIGAPVREEEALVDPYKGIRRDERGRQTGQSELWTRWGVRKQLLDDLYIRFFRLAEECIGVRAEYGIVSYISNSSFLAGRSHPIMRESLLQSFDAVWIDNLHGNRLANERTPWGESCETVFSTGDSSSGIKVGVAITTWIKRQGTRREPMPGSTYIRDFWGSATSKRQALLDSLDMDRWSEPMRLAAAATPAGPRSYLQFQTDRAHRWKLLPYDVPGGYEDWPSIDALFPLSSPGVNPNRGLDASVIDIDARRLRERMRAYFSGISDSEMERAHPELMTRRSRYDPARTRQELLRSSAFDEQLIRPIELFPFDLRYIYHEIRGKLLDYSAPEIASATQNELLIGVNQARRASETRPLYATCAVGLHINDVGAQAYLADRLVRVEQALDGHQQAQFRPVANLAVPVWNSLGSHWGIAGDLGGPGARKLIRDIFRLALAIGHSPAFQRDFFGSLSHDWLRIPIPRDRAEFERAVPIGDALVVLLDPLASATQVQSRLNSLIGHDAIRLAILTTADGRAADEDDLRIEINHFGAAPGGWRPRPPRPDEPWHDAWGEGSGDLWLNGRVYLGHVPERAWTYELGGYQVVKKWLGYREARRRSGAPLSFAEKDHLRSMIQRISAILLLEPQLDTLYERAAADAFTAEELGL